MFRESFLRNSSFVVAAIGLADAIYLTWVKLAHQEVYCGGYGGCNTISASPYSSIAGVPIAALGALAYLTILVLLILESRYDFWRDNAQFLIFGISLVGVLYSAYLTYLELAVIYAICFYCVISAIAVTILFVLSIFRLVRGQAETNPV